jgi:hypothetical protein
VFKTFPEPRGIFLKQFPGLSEIFSTQNISLEYRVLCFEIISGPTETLCIINVKILYIVLVQNSLINLFVLIIYFIIPSSACLLVSEQL